MQFSLSRVLKLLLVGGLTVGILFFGIPYMAIKLNISLGLPVINLFLLKIVGILLIFIDAGHTFFNVFNFIHRGFGTPVHIDPPKKLVTDGIYKYTRNPMYLAHFLGLLGILFVFGHLLLLIYLFFFIIGAHLLVVLREEPVLKKRFGKEFEEYIKKVPRWL